MKDPFCDHATNRQLKVLRFFNQLPGDEVTRRVASGIIGRIFMIPEHRERWQKYVFLTGDETQDSPELLSFNPWELMDLVVPDNWKPRRSRIRISTGFQRDRLLELVTDILKDGVPFDDPVPEITFRGHKFCCTGKFLFGTRNTCDKWIVQKGGIAQENVTLETHYLIVGGIVSPSWAEESYGKKIERALRYKLDGQELSIIAEEDWAKTIEI